MKKHIARAVPLWREAVEGAPVITECGRIARTLVVVPREEARKGISRRELLAYRFVNSVGRGRVGPDVPDVEHLKAFCSSCLESFEMHYGADWALGPEKVVTREAESSNGVQNLIDELNALAAMALADPEKFNDAVRRERALRAIRGDS